MSAPRSRIYQRLSAFAETSWAPVLVFGFTVLVAGLNIGDKAYYALESDLVMMGLKPLAALWELDFQDQSHFFPLLVHGWSRLFGSSAGTLRMLGVLAGAGTAVIAFQLASLWHSRAAGLAAGLIFPLIAGVHEHIRTARMYGVFIALTLGSMLFAARYQRGALRAKPGRGLGDLAALLLCILAGVYTHFFGFGVAIMAVGYTAVGLLLTKRWGRLKWLLWGVSLVALASIPQLLRAEAAMGVSEGHTRWAVSHELPRALEQMGIHFWVNGSRLPRSWSRLGSQALFLGGIALTLWGCARIRGPRDKELDASLDAELARRQWLWDRFAFAAWVFGSAAVLLYLGRTHDIRPRYFCYLLGPTAVGIGMALVPGEEKPRPWLHALPALVLGTFVLTLSISGSYNQHLLRARPYDQAAHWIQRRIQPDDLVVTLPSWTASAIEIYFDTEIRNGNVRGLDNPPRRLWVVDSMMDNNRTDYDWLEERAIRVEEKTWRQLRLRLYDFAAMRRARAQLSTGFRDQARADRGVGMRLGLVGDLVPAARTGNIDEPIIFGGLSGFLAEVDVSLMSLGSPGGGGYRGSFSESALAGFGGRLRAVGLDVLTAVPRPGDERSGDQMELAQALAAGPLEGTVLTPLGNLTRGAMTLGPMMERLGAGVRLGIVALSAPAETPELPERIARELRLMSSRVDHLMVVLGHEGGDNQLMLPAQRQLIESVVETGARIVVGRTGQAAHHVQRIGEAVIIPELGPYSVQRPLAGDRRSDRGRIAYLVLDEEEVLRVETFPLVIDERGHPGPGARHTRRLEAPPPSSRVAWRASDELASSAVYLNTDGERGENFAARRPRHTTQGNDMRHIRVHAEWDAQWWASVGWARDRAKGFTRTGVWAHPPREPGGLEIAWPAAPMTEVIEGYCAVSDEVWDRLRSSGRRERLPPTKLELLVDGYVVAERDCGGERGWRRFRIDTSAYAGGEHEISVLLTAERYPDQYLTFDLWAAEPEPVRFPELDNAFRQLHTFGAYSFRLGLAEDAEAEFIFEHGRRRACERIEGETYLEGEEFGPDGEGLLSNRLQCGPNRDPWNVVATTRQRATDFVQDCIWAHPMDDGALEIRYPQRVIGSALEGIGAITDLAVSKRDYPVHLEIEIGDRMAWRGTFGEEPGWESWRVDTSSVRGQAHDVVFRVTTDRQRWRHFCFDAQILR